MSGAATRTSIKVLTDYLAGSTTAIVYFSLLIYIWRKNRNRWLLGNVLMISLSGLALIELGYGYGKAYG